MCYLVVSFPFLFSLHIISFVIHHKLVPFSHSLFDVQLVVSVFPFQSGEYETTFDDPSVKD